MNCFIVPCHTNIFHKQEKKKEKEMTQKQEGHLNT